MDRVGADFAASVQSIVDRLGARPGADPAADRRRGRLRGHHRPGRAQGDPLHRLDRRRAGRTREIPAELADAAAEAAGTSDRGRRRPRRRIIAMAFLEDEEIDAARLRTAIRACTLDLSITPVLCGSAFKNKGVQPLLDAIIDYLPTPLDRAAVTGIDPKTARRSSAQPSLDEPFCALAFKIMSDPFVGKLTYFRVYSGVLKAGSHVYNPDHGPQGARRPHPPDARQQPRGARVRRRRRDRRRRRPQAGHDRRHALRRGAPDPAGVDHVPRARHRRWPSSPRRRPTRTSSRRRSPASREEDPTFRVRTDEETGQIVISGMGELHLEIIVDRLVREFNVAANVGKPQVAYRETVRKKVEKVAGQVRAPDRRPRPVRRRRHLARAEPRARATSSTTRSPVA